MPVTTGPDKIIVSNMGVMNVKYGTAGANSIAKAIKELIIGDAARGIVTALIDLSDAATMVSYGAAAISAASSTNEELHKKTIDAIYAGSAVRPSYLMLLGAPDVIPHISLDNPLFNPPNGDLDATTPSDMPYACEAPYATDAQNFIAPTRIIGRLPDVTKGTDPTYLVGLLKTAAKYQSRPPSDYGSALGVSAHAWKTSTELSLDVILGTYAGMKVSPTDGPNWTAAEAKRLMHFVNCHGAPANPSFFGQQGNNFPEAHSAAWMSGKLADGAVMAAECCYGAELYDPTLTGAAGQKGMANTYLESGAYAYFGSTNISYGPTHSNDQADTICQLFYQHLLAGASAGRACLQAKLDYVSAKGGLLTPFDHKTLMQFTLMGDPSVTPVAAAGQSMIIAGGTIGAKSAKSVKAAIAAVARQARQARRGALIAKAASTVAFRLIQPTVAKVWPKTAIFNQLQKLAAKNGIKSPGTLMSYAVGGPAVSPLMRAFSIGAALAETAPQAVHVMLQRMPSPKASPVILIKAIEAVEYAAGIEARTFVSR